jgi:nucleoside-diphosphate-sugar epimerase
VHTITEQAGTRRGSIGTDRRAGTLAPLGRSAAPPDGEQTRSSTYIDDCIQGTVMIAMGSRAEPINLGSSELVTINQLVSLVEEIADVELERQYRLDAHQGVRGRNK